MEGEEDRGLDTTSWSASTSLPSAPDFGLIPTNGADTGQPVFLPFRMSCYVICNLVVTAGMLTPNLGTPGTLLWQIANQSLNVGINTANANKSTPLSTAQLGKSYLLAVSASCSVAVGLNAVVPRLKRLAPTTRTILGRLVPFAAVATAGALNVFLMRAEEIRQGIDVYPAQPPHSITTSSSSIDQKPSTTAPVSSSPQTPPTPTQTPQSLGKSRIAALHAVSQTAISRILNATPIMVIPPLLLIQLQRRAAWLKNRPGLVTPVNLVLILTTSVFALPLALGAFPQRQKMGVGRLEKEFWDRGGETGEVEFNRGI